MLKHLHLSSLAIFATLVLWNSHVSAQVNFPSGYRSMRSRIHNRPTVSPYLSLLSVDNQTNGLPTYFTTVRPRIEAQRRAQEQDQQNDQLQRLQRQVSTVRRQMTQAQRNNGVFPTGHPTRFNNYSHYYAAFSRR